MGNELKIESLIKKEDRNKIYNVLYIGVSVYKRLLEDNEELINSKSFGEIKTRILSFVIKKQFEDYMSSLDFPYKIELKEVNNFGNKALFIRNNKVKIQINKTKKKGKMHNSNRPAMYMLNAAKQNSKYTREIKFFLDSDDKVEPKENNIVYIICGYGVREKLLDHLDFIIPEQNMNDIIDKFDALHEYNDLINDNNHDETVEKRIVALKEEALKFIK